jgi:hypothetical protein
MEKLPLAKQQWLAQAIVELMPMHQISQRSEGLKKLGSEKVMGLMRAKVKRRWYDQDPLIHQAFNLLYLMSDELRYEMAVKMLICIKILETKSMQDSTARTAGSLLRNIFDKPLAYLKDKTQFQAEQKPLPGLESDGELTAGEPNSGEMLSSRNIETSQNLDMKIVRLKRI